MLHGVASRAPRFVPWRAFHSLQCARCVGVTGRCRVWEENESAWLDWGHRLDLKPRGRAECLPCESAGLPGRRESRAHQTHLGPVPSFPLVAAGIVLARLLGFWPCGRIAFPLGVGARHGSLLGPFPTVGGTLQDTMWICNPVRLGSSPSTPRQPYSAPVPELGMQGRGRHVCP